MYRTNFGIGHRMQAILDAHTPPAGGLGAGHKGLFDTVNNSLPKSTSSFILYDVSAFIKLSSEFFISL